MAETPAGPLPGDHVPTPQDVQECNDMLRELQLMLGGLGKDDRRKSPEFQEMMGIYKGLGASLHEARKRIAPVKPAGAAPGAPARTGATAPRQAPAGPRPAGSASALSPRPAAAPGQGRPAAPAGPGSVSALGRAAQAYGAKPGAAGTPAGTAAPNSAVVTPQAAGAAAQAYGGSSEAAAAEEAPAEETSITVEAASSQAAGLAAQAYGGQPAARAPRVPLAPSAVPVGAQSAARAAQAYGVPAPGPPAAEQPQAEDVLPAGLPLNMAKFKSALGPPSPRTVYRGPELDNLQQLLIHLGYRIEPTGTFDVPTLRAVNMFQKKNKLPVAQVVGSEMRRLLNEMVTG